jgi:5'-methylthioadenosine phosphorylase
MQEHAEIGIIGGSGLYEMEGFTSEAEVTPETPFGKPSDAIVIGELEGKRVAFLPRHGRGHRILPSELNFRANIFAMKALGVHTIYSVSAVGSLKEQYAPLHVVVPDQFVDRTFARPTTFFGRGLVAHVAFAHPISKWASAILAQACADAAAVHHVGGTYVCIEGPQFSTRAESELYRSWGMDIIGMTNLQEAKLAREAEICYATLALVTDYDCWHPSHDSVTVEQVIANLTQNIATAKEVLRRAVRATGAPDDPECTDALRHALMTPAELVPAELKRELAPLLSRYMR